MPRATRICYVLACSTCLAHAAQLSLAEIDAEGESSPWEDLDTPLAPTSAAFSPLPEHAEALTQETSAASEVQMDETKDNFQETYFHQKLENPKWQIILRYSKYAYKPTSKKVGDVNKNTGFAKLSDDAINAISSQDKQLNFYKVESDMPHKKGSRESIYIRTSEKFDDTKLFFGFSEKNDLCQAQEIDACTWTMENKPLEWSPGGDNCHRWIADNHAWRCYKGQDENGQSLSMDKVHRCFNAGKECSQYPMRENVIMYKFGKQEQKPSKTATATATETATEPEIATGGNPEACLKTGKKDKDCCAEPQEASCARPYSMIMSGSCGGGAFKFSCWDTVSAEAVAPTGIYSLGGIREWETSDKPPYLWSKTKVLSMAKIGNVMFAVKMSTDGAVLKMTLTGPDAGSWRAFSKPNVTSIAIHGDVMYAAASSGQVMKQTISKMSSSSNWVVTGAKTVRSIAIYDGYIYGCAGGEVLRQALSKMTDKTAWQTYAKCCCNTISIFGGTAYVLAKDGKLYSQKLHSITETSNWAAASAEQNAGIAKIKATSILVESYDPVYAASKAALLEGKFKVSKGLVHACPDGRCDGGAHYKIFCTAETEVSLEFEISAKSAEKAKFSYTVGKCSKQTWEPRGKSGKTCADDGKCIIKLLETWLWSDFSPACSLPQGLSTVKISDAQEGLVIRQLRIVEGGEYCSLHHVPFVWHKIAHQTILKQFPSAAKSVWEVNPNDTKSDAYLDLKLLKSQDVGLKFDGKHRFKAIWDDYVVEWKQSSWITDSVPTGLECIRPSNCGSEDFKGLGKSSGSYTFDGDGSGEKNVWTVGALQVNAKGFPGGPNGKLAKTVTLYVARSGWGIQGEPGPVGPIGSAGQTGKDGSRGTAGKDGTPGTVGKPGETGPPGANGPKGPEGAEGKEDATGADGLAGYGSFIPFCLGNVLSYVILWYLLKKQFDSLFSPKAIEAMDDQILVNAGEAGEGEENEEEAEGEQMEEEAAVEEEVQPGAQGAELQPVTK
mmetsp:Transcript_104488/g.185877  ORF Transcript_104488/g.185877 Transcript_104488/m.185877 type:complete len:1006 (-) Transcript_104488:3-3020(-)